MYFTKYPHRSNFSFAHRHVAESQQLTVKQKTFELQVEHYVGNIAHVQIVQSDLWDANRSLEALNPPSVSAYSCLHITDQAHFEIKGKHGLVLLEGQFGVSGKASMFTFKLGEATHRFYGMGEKSFGRIELAGYRTRFWNTDVWGDFHQAQYENHPTDPSYFSTPYLVVKVDNEYVGLLLHNPYPTFLETPGTDSDRAFDEWRPTSPDVILGSEDGEPNLWVLYGDSLKSLTQKLQKLVGVTPLPPAWSLGYHQSRWGYIGHDDLLDLDQKFADKKIPCDSLWMDLDYMDGYRIFKTSDRAFPDGTNVTAEALAKNDRRIVPILDPGVKFEPGYAVYDDGHKQDIFCKNAEGTEFVGLVWPGETVFPDFSQPSARQWWADYVEQFRKSGFGATWVDMNDPSTGPVDPNGMLFANGQLPHTAYHNQYALGMQMATQDGFLKACPNERPFILSRSGYTGSSKYSAIWTGDNLSNYFYLKNSIPASLNLSLSGLPFNGPDMGGFGGCVTDGLMIDWVKAGFLFPFLRNHCAQGQRNQEPFAFPDPVMSIVRRYIRLRYKLFPYLYNLFVEQEASGDPIMRPLMYEFDDRANDRIDDQFLVGPSILQAPFVEEKSKTRSVVLPGSEPWYEAASGEWKDAGSLTVKNDRASTPLFVRAGAVIAMQPGTPTDNRRDLSKVHLHVFVPNNWSGESVTRYVADDGISFDYRLGKRSELKISLASANGNLAISVEELASGFGRISPTFVIHGDPKSVRLNGSIVKLDAAKVVLTGKPLKVSVVKK